MMDSNETGGAGSINCHRRASPVEKVAQPITQDRSGRARCCIFWNGLRIAVNDAVVVVTPIMFGCN